LKKALHTLITLGVYESKGIVSNDSCGYEERVDMLIEEPKYFGPLTDQTVDHFKCLDYSDALHSIDLGGKDASYDERDKASSPAYGRAAND
jgi:hypothetical protein